MYDKGEGIEQDKQKSFYWYSRAAEQGNAVAQHNLGVNYSYGNGIEQDKQKAFYWYTEAANQGLSMA